MSLVQRLLLRRYPELAKIPGPTPRLPLGNMQDFAHGRPWETSLDYQRRFGPYTLFWVAHMPAVFVHEPRAIAEILQAKRASFVKREPTEAMRPAATSSNFFIANGESWAHKRRLDFFSCDYATSWLAEQFSPTVAFVRRRLATLARERSQEGKVGGFERELYRLVFDVQSFLLFGRRLSPQAFADFNHMLDVTDMRMKTNLPLVSPRFFTARDRWHRAIAEQLELNEDAPEGRFLSHVLARRNRLPREQLVTELANVYPGGVFSMTSALCHLCGLLWQSPRDRQRLTSVLGGDGNPPTYGDICACIELEAAIRETLRLYAPAPVFMRTVKADAVEVGDLHLPRGVRVLVGILPLHRDPTVWREPEAFLPERWTPEVMARHSYGSDYFFPFGRGPRTCGGQDLALFTIRCVALAVLTSPHVVRVTPPKHHRFYFGCMMPKGIEGTLVV